MQGWHEGVITFNPTYKYHLGCNVYSGDPLPPGIGAVKAVESFASLTDSEATTEGTAPGVWQRTSGTTTRHRALQPYSHKVHMSSKACIDVK